MGLHLEFEKGRCHNVPWYIAAIASAVGLAAQSLGLQQLQRRHAVAVYMTWVWLGAAIPLAAIGSDSMPRPFTPTLVLMLLVAGGASYGGMYAFGRALQSQQNVGYIEAVAGLRTVAVFGYAVVIDSAGYDGAAVAALAGSILAVVLLGAEPLQADGKVQHKIVLRLGADSWLGWSLLSAGMFSVLIIVTEKLITGQSDPIALTAIILTISGLMFALTAVRTAGVHSLAAASTQDVGFVIVTAAAAAIGNAALFGSVGESPNAAYAVAISSSRIGILYLVSLGSGRGKFEPLKTAAVVIMTISVVILSRA